MRLKLAVQSGAIDYFLDVRGMPAIAVVGERLFIALIQALCDQCLPHPGLMPSKNFDYHRRPLRHELEFCLVVVQSKPARTLRRQLLLTDPCTFPLPSGQDTTALHRRLFMCTSHDRDRDDQVAEVVADRLCVVHHPIR
jgi:hypothetical protein